MAKTYSSKNKQQRIREPLYSRHRAKYRGVRHSLDQNVETNLIKIDISRILDELESIDVNILNDLTILVGEKSEITDTILLDDGLSYTVEGVAFTYGSSDFSTQVMAELEVDTLDKMSSKLSRLQRKTKDLEVQI
jgi:hypothetical protein